MKLFSRKKPENLSKIVICDVRLASPHPRVVSLRQRIWTFTFNFNLTKLWKLIQNHRLAFGTTLLLLLVGGGFLNNYLSSRAQLAIYYPSSALGTAKHPENAQGEPSLDKNSKKVEFTEENSALLDQKESELYLGNFQGEIPEGAKPEGFFLSFLWNVKEKDSVQNVTRDILEISYTLDNSNWQTLGKADSKGKSSTFELPLTRWSDLSKVQISIKSTAEFGENIQVYLDGATLGVEYQEASEMATLSQEEIDKLPKKKINSEEVFLSPQKDFQSNEEVEFEVKLPDSKAIETSTEAEAPTSEEPEVSVEEPNVPAEEPAGEEIQEDPDALPETDNPAVDNPDTLPDQEPSQELSGIPEAPSLLLGGIRDILGAKIAKAEPVSIASLAVTGPDDQPADIYPQIDETSSGAKIFIPIPGRDFKPGKYTLTVGFVSGGTLFSSSQDFTWGVLAINTNKSIYAPGEKGTLAMAVLDDTGHMVCNAQVKLKVTSDPPAGEAGKLKVEEELSTDNGRITVNPECSYKGFTLTPDYEAQYDFGEVGEYSLELTATTPNGTHSITDKVEVKKNVPFDVERITATRIYPPENYPVTFNIIANQNFKGEIEESVPASFNITPGEGEYLRYEKEETRGDTKVITWKADIKEGDQLKLGYEFKAPDISPEFYLLGPLRFIEEDSFLSFSDGIVFEEARKWQIAADANAVTYVKASTGATDAGGAFTATGAAPAAAGNIIILQILQDGTTDSAVTFTSATNIENLAGTDNAWTAITEETVGATDNARQYLWIGRSLSTSAPTFTGGNSTSEDVFFRMYEFSGVRNGTTLASVLENGTAGTVTNGSGTSTSVLDTSVQTLGDGRLALNFIGFDDEVPASQLTAMAGETGGDWIYPVAAYGSSSGTDGGVALVTAAMASAGTINGGSDAITSYAWGVIGFALIPEFSPTTVLNSPDDASSTSDTTPTLNFTATDGNDDDVRYNIQIDTADTFDSQSGGTAVADSYTPTPANITYLDNSSGRSSGGQSFVGNGGAITSAVMSLRKAGLPTGSIYLRIFAHTGAYGTTGVPTGSALATSDGIDISTFTTSPLSYEFTFSGVNQITLENGTYYTLEINAPTVDASNYIWFYGSSTTGTHGGVVFRGDVGSWIVPYANDDAYFIINTNSGSPLLDKVSGTDAGFANTTDGSDTDPFDSGDLASYTVQAGESLSSGTYYWRVRAKDPLGSNSYGAWSATRSFTIDDVFTISGSSDMRTNAVVKVAINGTPDETHTGNISASDGTWSIAGATVSSGQSVIVFVEETTEANESTAITTYDGSGSIAGLVLNANVLSIGNSDGRSIDSSNLDDFQNSNNENVMHSFASSALTVDGGGNYSAEKIRILSGNTLTVGSSETLSTFDLNIDSTGVLTSGGASSYNIANNWTNAGTFTASTSTINFTATDAGNTITDGGSDFNNIIFNGSNGGWSFADSTTLNGDLTMTAGTLSGTSDITVKGGDVTGNGDISLTGGTFTIDNTETGTPADTLDESFTDATFPPITCDSGWTTGGNANWARDTVNYDTSPASAVAPASITDSQSSWLDCNVTLSEPLTLTFKWRVSSESGYDYLNYCEDIDGTCARTTKTLGISGTVAFTEVQRSLSAGTHSLRWLYAKDSSSSSGSDVGWVDTVLIAGGEITGEPAFGGATNWDFNSLAFNGASGATAASGTGSITVADTLSIGASHTLQAGSKDWILTDSVGSPVTPFVATGTLEGESSTFIYANSGIATNITVAAAYNDLTLSPSSATTFSLAGNLTGSNGITGDLTIGNDATLTTTGSSYDIDIGGSWTISSSGIFTVNSSTVTFDDDGTDNFTDSTAGLQNMGSVVINGSSGKVLSAQTDMKVHDLDIMVGSTLDITDENLTITGTGTPFTRSGTETFAGKVDYYSDEPYSVAIGDLNNDGWNDMASANYDYTDVITVFINEGDGTFASGVEYPTGSYPRSIAIGDIDNDGWADLAVANYYNDSNGNSVSIFKNNQDGTFSDRVNYPTGIQPISVAIGDMDSDGFADLAVANRGSNSVSVFRNNRNSTFANRVDYATNTYPYSVAIGDVDNDGFADLAVANNGSAFVSIFINDQDGTFAGKADYVSGTGSYSVAIGDLDNDGFADLAVGNSGSDTLSIYINDSDGTFADKVDYYDQYCSFNSVAIGDLDNDGWSDTSIVCGGQNRAVVRYNQGDGSFSSGTNYTTGTYPEGIAIGDLDNDGWNDMATANSAGSVSISVFIGTGADFITDGSTVTYTGTSSDTNIAIASYNNLALAPAASTNYKLVGDLTEGNGLTGSLTIGSDTTLSTVANLDYDIDVGGNWTNSGTFTANESIVTLDGTSEQNLSGTMTGSSAFYDLTITNSSGSSATDNERTGFTPGVDFDAAARATHIYRIRAANARVEYESGATFEFADINWNGFDEGTKICFRNSSASDTWLLKVTGTQTAVSYVDVSRSDASVSGGNPIQAYDGTNRDSKNNTDWMFFNIRARQEINLQNGSFSSLSGSNVSIGISSLNPNYSGNLESYFEIVAKNTDSAVKTIYLKNWSGGSVISQIDLPAGVTDYTRIRSVTSFTFPVSLTSVYIDVPTTTSDGQIEIFASRVIVLQDNGEAPPTSEETQIEIGNYETSKINTSSSPLDYPKYWLYEADNWDGTKSFYAEAAYVSSSASGNVTIKLQKDDAGDLTTWSDVVTIVDAQHPTTMTLSSRVSFTPVDNCNYRIVDYISSGSYNYTIYNSKIIVDQTGAAVNKVESQYLVQNTYKNTTGFQNFDSLWDPSEWNGTFNEYYHEINSSSDTGDSAKLQIDPNNDVELADVTICDSSVHDGNIYGGTGSSEMIGQSFTVPIDHDVVLKSVSFELYKTGSPTDNIYVEVASGSFSGTTIATSDPIAASSMEYDFEYFTFSSPPTLSANTKYFLRVLRDGARDTSNYIHGLNDNEHTNPLPGGGSSVRSSGSWGYEDDDEDRKFSVYGESLDIDNSTATGAYRARSSAMTMPSSADDMDVNILDAPVYASRIIVRTALGFAVSGSSDLSSGTVAIAVNNTLLSGKTGTISDGAWSITSLSHPGSDAFITVWVTGADDGDESTGIAKYSGNGNMTGMALNDNTLSIGGIGNQSISISDLSDASNNYDNGDNEDVMHTASGTTLTVDGGDDYASEKIDILSSDTLAVEGTGILNTHSIDIHGTLSSGGNSAYNIAGDWALLGTFVPSSSTVTFNGSGTSNFYDYTSGQDMGAVVINGSSGKTVSTQTSMKVTTLNIYADNTLDITGDTLTITGTGTPFTKSGTFTTTGSTVVYSGSGTTTNITATVYNNLTLIPTSATTYNLTNHLTSGNNGALSGNLTISTNATLDVTASNYNIEISGNWTNSGAFTPGTGTVTFDGSGTQVVNAGGTASNKAFNNFTHSGAGTIQLSSTGIDVNGTFSQPGGTFNCNGQNQNFAGAFTLNSGTSWTSGGTLTFDGSSGTTNFTDSNGTAQDLGTVVINGSSGKVVSAQTAMKVTTLNIAANNTLDITSRTLTITGTGTPFIKSGTFTITSSTVIYAGSGSATNITTTVYNNLTLTPTSTTTYSLTGDLTGGNGLAGNMTINSDATLSVSDLSGAIVDSYSESNAFTTEYLSSEELTAIGQSLTGDGGTLSSVKFYLSKYGSPTGNAVAKVYAHSGTYGTSSVPTGAALATSDNFDVSNLATSPALATLTFSGGNKITLGNGTHYVVSLEYSGGDSSNDIMAGVDYNMYGNHSGNFSRYLGSWEYIDYEDLCFYVYKDEAPAFDINVAGNWTNNVGTSGFTAGSGTVTFTGGDSSTQTFTGNTTFNDFTANASALSGRTLAFADGSTQTVDGTWTVAGATGKVITLTRTGTGSNWTIDPAAASVTYVAVDHSTNTGVSFCATYSTDDPSNVNWSVSSGDTCITLSLDCAASVNMTSYTIGDPNNYVEDTPSSSLCTIDSSNSSWTLTAQSSDFTGTHNSLSNLDVFLRTDGDPGGVTVTSPTSGISETTSGSYSLDSLRTIISGSSAGTYSNGPTLKVQDLNNLYEETTSGTLTFTLQ